MGITKVTTIKPKQNIHNKINKVFRGASLRRLEQNILSTSLSVLYNADFVKSVVSLSEEECETLNLAPCEARRFADDICMVLRSGFAVVFEPLDGKGDSANIILSFDSQKLERAFSIYASGSFRRDDVLAKFGEDLKILIPANTMMRHAKYQVTIEPTYTTDNLIKIVNQNVYRNENNWITLSITNSIKQIINVINNRLAEIDNE